jgi:hypothetical protein
MVTRTQNSVGWAAHLFRLGVDGIVHAFGAVRVSPRLHWTQRAACNEAEEWAREIQLASLIWETVDETAAVAWTDVRGFVVRSMELPLGEPPTSEGITWAAFLFNSGAGAIVHPAFGVVRGSTRLHWTEQGARREAEEWAHEMQVEPLVWETIDETGAVAWINHDTSRAFVVRSILMPQGEPPA